MTKRTLGDDIEDHYYGTHGVFTGSVANQIGLAEYQRSKGTREPYRASNGGGQGFVALLGLFALFLALAPYVYASTVFFSFWSGEYTQGIGHFLIYTVMAFAALVLVAKYVGFWAALATSFIALLPVIHSISEDTGYWWIIFREESGGGEEAFRWTTFVAATILNLTFAYLVRKEHRAKIGIRERWSSATRFGRVSMGVLAGILAILSIAILIAVGNFGNWGPPSSI